MSPEKCCCVGLASSLYYLLVFSVYPAGLCISHVLSMSILLFFVHVLLSCSPLKSLSHYSFHLDVFELLLCILSLENSFTLSLVDFNPLRLSLQFSSLHCLATEECAGIEGGQRNRNDEALPLHSVTPFNKWGRQRSGGER